MTDSLKARLEAEYKAHLERYGTPGEEWFNERLRGFSAGLNRVWPVIEAAKEGASIDKLNRKLKELEAELEPERD